MLAKNFDKKKWNKKYNLIKKSFLIIFSFIFHNLLIYPLIINLTRLNLC